jgi:hypothetical protein
VSEEKSKIKFWKSISESVSCLFSCKYFSSFVMLIFKVSHSLWMNEVFVAKFMLPLKK